MTRARQIVVALLIGWPILASGHTFEPAVLALAERDGGVFDVVWRLPESRGEGSAAPAPPLAPRLPEHCRTTAPPVKAGPGAPEVFRIDCGADGLRGASIGAEGLGPRAEVVVRIGWRDGEVTTGVLREPGDVVTVSALGRGAAWAAVFRGYVLLGVEHILLGVDHLCFVLGLVMLVPSVRRLVETVTAFTVAHSISLALAVLDLVRLPGPPVEALIAASIVLVAVEAARPSSSPTITRRRPWLVAFGFGLVHGLGFAGALADVGVPADRVGLALLAFNVGVEAGQLGFVMALLAGRSVARRVGAGPMLRPLVAHAVGAVAVAWTIERSLAMIRPF